VFEKLDQRVIYEGEIEALTPLHVGSGKAEAEEIAAADLPIMRDPRGTPYIPGSSMKGKTRAEAERIARSLNMRVCNPPAIEDMCGSKARSEDDLCIVCKVFGTASMRGGVSRASKVKFRDAYPTTKVEAPLVRTGIALNRSTGSVKAGALYSIEAIPAGTRFHLEIVTENMTPDESKLLKAALRSIQDGSLGGHTSRGMGKITLSINKATVRTAKYYLGEEAEKILSKEEVWK